MLWHGLDAPMGNIDDVKYPLNDVTLFITDAIQAGAQNMRQLLAVLAITIAGVCLAVDRCETKYPNVVLVISDDQRPDTIAALGNRSIKTPHLDQLVQRGSVFLNATCANPICTPSRGELLTGCTGIRNQVFDFGRTLDPALKTLPEPFNDAGYTTWYCGKWHNDGRPGKHGYRSTRGLYTGGGGKWWKPQTDYRGHPITGYKGWIFRDQNDQPLPKLGVGLTPNISATIADAAIDVIESSTSPYLLHVNFTAPHDPLLIPRGFENLYDPASIPLPENFQADHPFDHGNRGGRDENLLPTPRTQQLVKADLAAYYAVISHMDSQIGRIIAAIDKSDQAQSTLIVFCSDHGLAMGSHGLRGKQNMYDHTIRVPIILAGPGIPKGKKLKGHAYLRDLFPTLVDLAGLPPIQCDGRSQVPVLHGQASSMYDFTVGYFRNSQRMIRTDQWKLIEYPLVKKTQLFDLKNDPLEQHDLSIAPEHNELKRRLSAQLSQWLKLQKTHQTSPQ
ncbi:MAG TPA: choline-sulfatase [Rhodopirellula sp.]|nr:choline-sulfatase [Rhodopirellula sp.]